MSNVVVPVHNPDGRFHLWKMEEIFRGPGTGRYIPNVDDAVWDWETGLYRVVEVNLSTGLSVLEPYRPPEDHGPDVSDILIGGERSHLVEDFRVFIDTSVVPHTLAIDNRRLIYGSTKSYVKLFLGTDIGTQGEVISAMYDQSGTFLGENIPLEVVSIPKQSNSSVKVPSVGFTTYRLNDGEIVTCVVYSDDGHATDIYRLIVKNTAFIRTADATREYIVGIHLESPFMSPVDSRRLEVPINMPIDAIPLTGVVTYSNGNVVRLPIGNKFRLHGLDNYVATVEGQRLPLTLTYLLSQGEYTYGANSGSQHHISESYWVVTKEFEDTFSLKLFTFPNWVDEIHGYQLDHFLYSLDRKEFWNVTDKVKFTDNSPRYNPMLWGGRQSLQFEVELGQVSSRFPPFRHVQTADIILRRPPNQDGTKWTVGFEPNQFPTYGDNLAANLALENVNNWKLDISLGETNFDIWINRVFHLTKPLFNSNSELNPPTPNVINVATGGRRYEINAVDFDKIISIHKEVLDGQNVYLEFVHRTPQNDLQLGIAGIPVRRI